MRRAIAWWPFLAAGMLGVIYVLLTGPLDRSYLVGQFVSAGCVALASVGLAVVVGGSHQFHLGQGFFFGLGAYWSAIGSGRWSWPPLVALVSAVLLCGVIAWLIGRVLNRVSGLYFAIATLALVVIGTNLAFQLRSFTGGDNGLSVKRLNIAGWEMNSLLRSYVVVWGTAIVATFVAARYLKSRRGRAVRAVGGDEAAARALGISATVSRTQAFVISATYAGLAGGLLAFSSRFLYPDSFGLVASVEMIVYVIVGSTTVVGALFATALLSLVPVIFEQLEGHLELVLGVVLVALLVLLPDDIRLSSLVTWRPRVRPRVDEGAP